MTPQVLILLLPVIRPQALLRHAGCFWLNVRDVVCSSPNFPPCITLRDRSMWAKKLLAPTFSVLCSILLDLVHFLIDGYLGFKKMFQISLAWCFGVLSLPKDARLWCTCVYLQSRYRSALPARACSQR